jgi:hypothetical protein
MKQQMEAELMMDNPETADAAVAELVKQGWEVEVMDWNDEDDDGELITPTTWLIVSGMSELSDDEFFEEMNALALRLGGDIVQGGYRGARGIKEVVEEHNKKCANA